MNRTKLPLGMRVGSGFAVVLILMVAITIIAIVRMNNLSSEMAAIYDREKQQVQLAANVIDLTKDISLSLTNLLVVDAGNRGVEKERIEKSINELARTMDMMSRYIQSADAKSFITSLSIDRKSIPAFVERVVAAVDANDVEDARQILQRLQDHTMGMIEGTHLLVQLQEKEMATTIAAAKRSNLLRSSIWMIILGGLAVIFGSVMAGLLSRSIVRPINRVAEGLMNAADQVASASGEVAQSSQALAQDATVQASSLEETSSSMEEMAAMTRRNADNANHANAVIQNNNKVVEETEAAMSELNAFMKEITKASEETGRIVKTIDEIAFQTNLLALNAAVEAARAGSAGAGFAVVAEEVRSLAIRAAEAAKNTAELIDNTVKQTKSGLTLVDRTSEAFRNVAEGSKEVAMLVEEIAASSDEQAKGVDQINRAVIEIDKIVQRNVSNAEESAAASEEMTAQAWQMKTFVAELTDVIGHENHSAMIVETALAADEDWSRLGESDGENLPVPLEAQNEIGSVTVK